MASIQQLTKRAALIQAVRIFFTQLQFLEVDTPLLLPANAPETYIEPIGCGEKFLQTSPELCMKRLLSQGLPKLFQISKCFRNNERGRLHLPEFLMLEWYRAGANYMDLMEDCRKLFQYVDQALGGSGELSYDGKKIDLQAPWERLTVAEAFADYANMTPEYALEQGVFEEVLVDRVEPCLGQASPTFLYDFPAALGALAKLQEGDNALAERFELYVAGLELANGFSELTDAGEQRRRFQAEREMIHDQGRNPGPVPEKFLADLERMPEAAGIALGLDRMVMLFCGALNVDEVVAFVPEDL